LLVERLESCLHLNSQVILNYQNKQIGWTWIL
jgi:hypothetical protein